jgi:U4/U6.U5 tri-snRNP-associated protein 2
MVSEFDPSVINSVIHRDVLDFDDDLRCSITLSKENLYVCLSCGKCLSGGSQHSPLIEHFMSSLHSVALRLADSKIVALPDFEPIPDHPAFEDIKFCANPTYESTTLTLVEESIGLNKAGFYGLDPLSPSHGRISVLRFLSVIRPLRDFLLLNGFSAPISHELSRFFKRFFNPFCFTLHFSPRRLLRVLPDNDDPFLLLCVVLNSLNRELGAPNVVAQSLQVQLSVDSRASDVEPPKAKLSHVWVLPLNLEIQTLYRDGLEREAVIKHVKFEDLLKKYDSETVTTEIVDGQPVRKRMKVVTLPPFLIVNLNRIRKNEFGWEKSNIHVVLPLSDLHFAGRTCRLRAMISHEGSAEAGEYCTFILNHQTGKWLKCRSSDATEVIAEVVGNSQCCFLLFEVI